VSNKKASVQEILNLISDFNLSELTMLQLEQVRIMQQRTHDFVVSIQNSDVNKLKELFELEVNFKDPDLWKKVNNLNLSNTNKETIDYLMNLDLSVKDIPGSMFCKDVTFRNITDVKQDVPVNPIYILQKFIKDRIEKVMLYYEFSEEVFNTAKKYFESPKFFLLAQHAIKNFAAFPTIEGYESIHNYIKENKSIFVPILFNNIKTENNLDCFMNDPKYKKFLENGIKLDGSKANMANAISEAALGKIRVLHKMGVNFPEEKPAYSNLFQKTADWSIPSQRYIIRNVEDITFNNQIILKTLLHSTSHGSKQELIQDVLDRYSMEVPANQIAELIPEAIKKRELTEEVLLVKKFGEYNALKSQVEQESNPSNIDKKRMKI
jgi:hypothetical protein